MMRRITSIIAAIALALASSAFIPAPVQAQNPGVRQRMQERLPAIDALKSDGRIGENNQGYLAVRGSLSADENSILAAENADRAEVYAAIARRTNTDADQVGRERARQIAERAAPGSWLQDEGGRWYRK